jgi:hypothetical protein
LTQNAIPLMKSPMSSKQIQPNAAVHPIKIMFGSSGKRS